MTKSQDKRFSILRTKQAFKMKQKAFFIIYKELSLKRIKQIFFQSVGSNLINLNISVLV